MPRLHWFLQPIIVNHKVTLKAPSENIFQSQENNCIAADWCDVGAWEQLVVMDHSQEYSGRIIPIDWGKACEWYVMHWHV